MSNAPHQPPVNVYEGNGQLSVAVPLPGAHAGHTEVVVTPDRIQIAAANKYPQAAQHFHRQDWQVGDWHVDVALPLRVDPAGARATLNLGVLVVMAPINERGAGESRPSVS